MKTKRLFTNGILVGIIGMLVIILTRSATKPAVVPSASYEFHDLQNT